MPIILLKSNKLGSLILPLLKENDKTDDAGKTQAIYSDSFIFHLVQLLNYVISVLASIFNNTSA